MSIKRRRLPILCSTATAAVAASLMVGSPAAVAAPTIPGGTLSVTCPGLGTFDVVTPPTAENADFTPAFNAATHQVFIPYQLSGTITVSGQEPSTFEDIKNAPVPADAITCTFEGTFGEGDFMVTITGTAVVVQRGAPG
jgi:hypothetical protein